MASKYEKIKIKKFYLDLLQISQYYNKSKLHILKQEKINIKSLNFVD